MNPRVLRILIPLAVAGLAMLVVATMFLSKPPAKSTAPTPPATSTNQAAAGSAPSQPSTSPGVPAAATTAASTQPLAGLRARPQPNAVGTPQPLGSIDPRLGLMRVSLTRQGAGISEIAFSDIWETAPAKRKSDKYEKSRPPGAPLDITKVDETRRYILQTAQPFRWISADGKVQTVTVPIFAAHSIFIDGVNVPLLSDSIWVETAPGSFEATIIDADDREIARLTRQFVLGEKYDVVLRQRIKNLTALPLDIRWRQYGPTELRQDKSGYIDNRRFNIGYLPDSTRLPDLVLANNSDLTIEHSSALGRIESAQDPTATAQVREQQLTIWPNRASKAGGFALSWFASTNRYFGMAVHPVIDVNGGGNRSLESSVQDIRMVASDGHAATPTDPIFTFLTSPPRTVDAGSEQALDMGLYAGPLDRHVLGEPPYKAIAMHQLILYQLSSCCAFLSFQWLADGLLLFLSFLHNYVFFDWGLAIIVLVCVVRLLLHPITKKSQVHMQRLGKMMSSLKPEIDKLQKKYPNDPKKMQQEQMRLMREHGINPLKMVGCLTIFLQTPIWIALWAMLYLAFDIRQQPAFYGVFQLIKDWPFLGDLSSPDSFIPIGQGFTIPLLGWHVDSINLMPVLMGVVFYIQQKYMTPPSATPLTPEQEQQQKIMKVMMVVMMPLFLYSAPSGLTLYMFTSSCIGILESKYIRAHITEMELNPPKPDDQDGKKPKGAKARAWSGALERARERARQKNAPPPRKFKDRE